MMKKRVGSFTLALVMALPLAACGQNTAAADYIAAQMESIGLEVEKVPVTVDKWQFNDASLTMEGTDISIMPASYAASSSRWPRPRPCRLWQNSWPHKVCSLQFAPAALYCG
ncbi:MAG: hypothetical protein Q4Q08_05030 [Eubacteriales bacterium]|nr:hypothetical protein [Eubacteriales bacterium]